MRNRHREAQWTWKDELAAVATVFGLGVALLATGIGVAWAIVEALQRSQVLQ